MTQEASYLAAFDSAKPDDIDWLGELRQRAMARFRVLGFPANRRGNEYWKYTDVGLVARSEFTPEPASTGIVGAIPKGVTVINLRSVNAEPAGDVKAHLGTIATFEADGFTALNTAMFEDAVVVHVAEGVSIEKTLRLALTSEEGVVSHPRVFVFVGRGARLSIAVGHYGERGKAYFSNAVIEVVANEDSSVTLYRAQREAPSAFHISTISASVGKNARFEAVSLDAGGGLVRHNMNVTLAAPGASCSLNGLYVAGTSQHVDNHTRIDHASPETTSAELYKGVLAGAAHGVFMGHVVVPKDSQRSETHQTNKTLLLSPHAEMDSQPMLEIYADDIKATHGSAIGQVDQEALFYLRSRGLSEAAAREILVQGFIAEVLDSVRDEDFRTDAERAVNTALAIS